MNYQNVPKELLLVSSDQTMQHLYGAALDIAGYCKAYREGFMNEPGDVKKATIINCTMHTPNEEQLQDMQNLYEREGRVVVLVGGQLGLMINVVKVLSEKGFLVVETVNDRKSVEEIHDGTTHEVSIFEYKGLRVLS